MHVPKLLMGLSILFLALACAPAEEQPGRQGQDAAVAAAEISARMTEYGEALKAGEVSTIAAFWTSDALVLEPGMHVTGEEIPAFLGTFLETGQVLDLQVRRLGIWVHGDVAYEAAEYDETIQIEGSEPFVAENHYFIRWERGEDGNWRMDHLVAGPREAPTTG